MYWLFLYAIFGTMQSITPTWNLHGNNTNPNKAVADLGGGGGGGGGWGVNPPPPPTRHYENIIGQTDWVPAN